jgi:hypothetical protein
VEVSWDVSHVLEVHKTIWKESWTSANCCVQQEGRIQWQAHYNLSHFDLRSSFSQHLDRSPSNDEMSLLDGLGWVIRRHSIPKQSCYFYAVHISSHMAMLNVTPQISIGTLHSNSNLFELSQEQEQACSRVQELFSHDSSIALRRYLEAEHCPLCYERITIERTPLACNHPEAFVLVEANLARLGLNPDNICDGENRLEPEPLSSDIILLRVLRLLGAATNPADSSYIIWSESDFIAADLEIAIVAIQYREQG